MSKTITLKEAWRLFMSEKMVIQRGAVCGFFTGVGSVYVWDYFHPWEDDDEELSLDKGK